MDQKRLKQAFEKAFAEFDALTDKELDNILDNPEYDGLYNHIADMTLFTKKNLEQDADLGQDVDNFKDLFTLSFPSNKLPRTDFYLSEEGTSHYSKTLSEHGNILPNPMIQQYPLFSMIFLNPEREIKNIIFNLKPSYDTLKDIPVLSNHENSFIEGEEKWVRKAA